MLFEASLALLLIMGLTWVAAIWASYKEESEESRRDERSEPPTQGSERPSKRVA